VSDEYLQALGRTRVGYLPALKQNRISLGLSTNLEAKLKARAPNRADSLADSSKGVSSGTLVEGLDGGRKIKLVSLNFSSLTYDFVRADSTGKGFVDPTFSISGNTDLLPGLDFRTSYSLFQGDPVSDTATFSPYRTDIGVSFSLNARSGIFALFGRLLGLNNRVDAPSSDTSRRLTEADENTRRQSQQSYAAGSRSRAPQLQLPTGQGWNMTLQYNAARQRRPRGGLQIENDPAASCRVLYVPNTPAFDQCVITSQNAPPTGLTTGQSGIGAPVFISPPVQNVTSALTFNITQNWAAQWSTQYDVTRARFASQQIGLQRSLHDWNAIFAFTQAPNGNFSFNFFIALKAQPELKFNYDRQTYRSSSF